MKWWDFSDKTFLIFFNIVIVAIVILLFVILSFSISCHYRNKYFKNIKKQSYTVRVYVIDVKKNSVVFFNRSDNKDKTKMNLSEFYNKFHPNDIEKVKNWIFSICMNHKTAEQYLEVDIISSKNRSYFSLLKLVKYDPAVGLLHIESHVLRYITPNNGLNKKKKSLVYGIVKRSVIKDIIRNSKALRGYTFAIRFFYIRQKSLSNDKIERYMIMTLKNEIYPFANDYKVPRQILDDGGNEIILFDLHILSNDDAMRLALFIEKSLRKCIGVNGFSDSVNFSIGIIENYQYYQDFDNIVKKAQETCMSAQANNQSILFYQKSVSQLLENNRYIEQVDSLMVPGNLRFLFRPIIDISRKKIIGHFEYVKCYNAPFTSFNEMSKYSTRSGKNRDLLAIVCKDSIPKFVNEITSSNQKLFFPLSLSNLDHTLEIFKQTPLFDQVKMVLVFDEQEINEDSNNLELITSSINSFHINKIECALLLKDKNLLLEPEFYRNFDYFIIGATMVGEIKRNNRIRLSIHTLIESLLKYDRPIIATDLEGWQAIELIVKSGIDLISSEIISPSNDMLLPIDKKKMEKLIRIGNDFN